MKINTIQYMVIKIMNKDDDINNFVPSLLNPRRYKKSNFNNTLTQNSMVSNISLSLGTFRNKVNELQKSSKEPGTSVSTLVLENVNPEIVQQPACTTKSVNSVLDATDTIDIDFTCNEKNEKGSRDYLVPSIDGTTVIVDNCLPLHNGKSLLSDSSELSTDTYVHDTQKKSDDTVILGGSFSRRPLIGISFALTNNGAVDVNSKSCAIKRIVFNYEHNNVNVNCDLIENSKSLSDYEFDDMHKSVTDETKKVLVNLEIRKRPNVEDDTDDSRVLILKTNAIEKFGHVTVQPPNYKLEKRKIIYDSWKGNKRRLLDATLNNGNFASTKLKQKSIHDFLPKIVNVFSLKGEDTNADQIENVASVRAMSKNSCVGDTNRRTLCKVNDRNNESPRSVKTTSIRREIISPRSQDVKIIRTETPHVQSAKVRNESASAHWPRKGIETLNFSLPAKSKSNRTSISPRSIPHHKIVAGTYFAVDAFSYGDIPNVKHYFLTHFHSDHYTGLKKSFNKQLFCSRITADLCISRLGVNPKSIHVISIDETIRIDGVEITAVDANHCPGALMLVFTLPNGKTLLHTGDFRASHTMESYPIFWNKDIHTVYLDTTYCNPRYDFPTQDQSLEMALQILKQKKTNLESAGKKFSSVLIVCGTYTIGKEKFFLGIARRVGCTVWACPEKDRILKVVEGQSFSHSPPQSCQLHVVPMRDLTHEKLRSYLDSLKGTFSEVVAFKPSGWENGKNSCVEKDFVTIHGIPYSEHSSFSELIRFIKFLKPKQVVPTVDISGGVKAVQKYFPCPLVSKDDVAVQSKVTDYFSLQNRQQVPAVT
uniref:DNA cross-link repair 1A protein n=2 Tax=Bombyx mori TaxID=7091 RepID=A0A8R2R351_BOMMO|nr:uncharacterized protein LOC101737956 isoform X1 [Bombyx mori]